MEKTFNISKNWEFGIYWRENWKFIGFVQYIGIILKKKQA